MKRIWIIPGLVIFAVGCGNPTSETVTTLAVERGAQEPPAESAEVSYSVILASCSNPRNYPADSELISQYRDLTDFLSSSKVPYVAMTSPFAGFAAGQVIGLGRAGSSTEHVP